MSAFLSDFVAVFSFFRWCKKKKAIRATMEGFVGGWVGGVALIRFPGGFGPLEIVDPGEVFWPCTLCFFHYFLYLDFVDILSILGRLLGYVFEH